MRLFPEYVCSFKGSSFDVVFEHTPRQAKTIVETKLKQLERKQGTPLPKIVVNWINSVKQTPTSKWLLQIEVDKGSGNCLKVEIVLP